MSVGLIILTGLSFVLKHNFTDYNFDDACRFLLENLFKECVRAYVSVCVFTLLGGYSMPKRFYFVMMIL